MGRQQDTNCEHTHLRDPPGNVGKQVGHQEDTNCEHTHLRDPPWNVGEQVDHQQDTNCEHTHPRKPRILARLFIELYSFMFFNLSFIEFFLKLLYLPQGSVNTADYYTEKRQLYKHYL